jgi:hypothetical protein
MQNRIDESYGRISERYFFAVLILNAVLKHTAR